MSRSFLATLLLFLPTALLAQYRVLDAGRPPAANLRSADVRTVQSPPVAKAQVASASGLVIAQPRHGANVTSVGVDIRLQVLPPLDISSVRLTLNGREVTGSLSKSCGHVHDASASSVRSRTCELVARLLPSNGLVRGVNRLVASARTYPAGRSTVGGAHMLSRAQFDYAVSLDGAPPTGDVVYAQTLPSVVGVTVSAGGVQPWVTIKTGTPATLVDPTPPTLASLPYSDTALPAATTPACTTTYQVLVLQRTLPVNQQSYTCYGDSASLSAYLATLASNSLVIVGTTPGAVAAPGLDTSGIGGTSYASTTASAYPQTYVVVGVPGAAAGTAYESYDTTSDPSLLRQSASAKGLLAVDVPGNYLFIPTNAYQFEVWPNNPATPGQSAVYIATQTASSSGVTGYLSPASSPSGFWLLVLDRVSLQPVDMTNTGYCPQIYFCGTLYPTGSPDPGTRSAAVAALAAALDSVTERQLAFVVSTGQPFQGGADVSNELDDAFAYFGGSHYTLPKLLSPDANYVLVGAGRGNSTRSPFTPGVVNSSSAFAQQGHTGIVRGVLERDRQGLYLPTVASQEDGTNNAPNATNLSLDYTFHQVVSFDPVDWPLTDTTAHILAYHAASNAYLTQYFQETGGHAYDLRWFYAGSPEKAQYNIYFLDGTVQNNTCMITQTLPSGASGFTLQDWCDARLQLYNELTDLSNSNAYLGPGGLLGLIKGSQSGGSIASDVIAATYEALNGQLKAPKNTSVNAKVADWMNLASALAAIPAAFAGPVGLTEYAVALGAISGALKFGAALAPLETSPTPLQYVNGFDVELGQLQNDAAQNATNLIQSYEQALDAAYTDWGKLAAIGRLAGDSSSGWVFSNQLSPTSVSQQLQSGVNRALYVQLLSQFFVLDTYFGSPVSSVAELGLFNSEIISNQVHWFCDEAYPTAYPPATMSPFGWAAYPGFLVGGTDIFVIGGTITNQNHDNVSENLPTTDLLQFLFAAPNPNDSSTFGYLNIPTDFIYAAEKQYGGVLSLRSGGPNMGYGVCYKPLCESEIQDNCKGP